ncbi:hypothetical protein INT80_00770 [Gallibacterium anatis]|uniref:Uncharacterized protein n=1 Tax=Gallibacterium anatis TaxID=750 RepID=A0A930Y888_9PAST|nr:hypothetical protein [Gallibacterium anatis]
MNAECASELVTLSAAFKSFQGYMLTADNPVMNSINKWLSSTVKLKVSEWKISQKRHYQMPKESIEGATVLTQLTIDAVVYGDKQAKNSLPK